MFGEVGIVSIIVFISCFFVFVMWMVFRTPKSELTINNDSKYNDKVNAREESQWTAVYKAGSTAVVGAFKDNKIYT